MPGFREDEEYKQEALELWRNSGRSAATVAAELGIRAPLLYRWAHLERGPDVILTLWDDLFVALREGEAPQQSEVLAEISTWLSQLRIFDT